MRKRVKIRKRERELHTNTIGEKELNSKMRQKVIELVKYIERDRKKRDKRGKKQREKEKEREKVIKWKCKRQTGRERQTENEMGGTMG